MKNRFKIAIIAGGTGGHIFPAISLIEQLILEKKEVVLFSDERVKNIIKQNKNLFKKNNINFYSIKISKKLKYFFNFFYNFFKIFCLLKKEKPDIVIGFGGYTSIPFLLVSKLLLKPIVLHEQNIIFGLANKLFAPFSKKVVFGWGDNDKKNNNYFYIRNPVRKEILNLRKKVKNKIKEKKINILIVGGSQGADIFDRFLPKSLNSLPLYIKKKITVYHQCSKKNLDLVKKNYSKYKINNVSKVFFSNIPRIMYKSKFVICRAGASTLSEITTLGKPSILIPYKFAKNNHQEKNASWLVSKGAGIILREDELTEKKIKDQMKIFFNNEKKLKKMSKNSFSIGDDNAALKLSNLIKKYEVI